MTIVKIVIIIILVVTALLASAYAYYGGFFKIEIQRLNQGGEIFVYKEMVGDYKQTPTISNEIYYSLLNDYKIETYKGCGIYLDDPKTMAASQLRSEVGCILEAKDSASIGKLSEQYKIKALPKGEYFVIEYPYKGMGSTIMSIMRVYPAFKEYFAKNKIENLTAPIEIYDIPNKKIIYRIGK